MVLLLAMIVVLLTAVTKIFLQGCTATVLLVWVDSDENYFMQCANVGDSACVLKYVFLISFVYLSVDQNDACFC